MCEVLTEVTMSKIQLGMNGSKLFLVELILVYVPTVRGVRHWFQKAL